eukprot:COSAG05_NODE_17847_length_318_cov_0.835616_1_plen_55_part_01
MAAAFAFMQPAMHSAAARARKGAAAITANVTRRPRRQRAPPPSTWYLQCCWPCHS